MADIDDFSVIRAFQRIVAVHPCGFRCKRIDEQFFAAFVDKHIVRGDAGLAAVDGFSEGYPSCSEEDVGIVQDDGRAFPSEFERDWGQIP